MSITAIVFDYGCVLSLPPAPEDFERLRKALGVDPTAFQEMYWRNREAYDLDALDTDAYWREIGRAAGAALSPEQVQSLALLDGQLWGRSNRAMMEWVRVLRARGLKTAILSNMSRGVGDYLHRTSDWGELFHHLCFSGELKIGKPQPEIYRHCLQALGEPAPQALFLDDREINVTAARSVGMHGIVFSSVEQLAADLEPFGLAESLAEARGRG
jgi:putative hydrolase of the HAD superfamily